MDGSRLGGSLRVGPRTHSEMKLLRLLLFPRACVAPAPGKSAGLAGSLARNVHVIIHPGRVILIDCPGSFLPKKLWPSPQGGGQFASSTRRRHWSPSFNFPTQQKVASSSAWGRSKRVSAMTHKVITLEFVVPTVLAIALGILFSTGAVYLTDKYLGPVDQLEANRSLAGGREIAELPNPDGRLSRVRLLLSR